MAEVAATLAAEREAALSSARAQEVRRRNAEDSLDAALAENERKLAEAAQRADEQRHREEVTQPAASLGSRSLLLLLRSGPRSAPAAEAEPGGFCVRWLWCSRALPCEAGLGRISEARIISHVGLVRLSDV